MTLLTRTLKNADGTQQIAIFDTEQQPTREELGVFLDRNGIEHIVPANTPGNLKLLGKIILIGKGKEEYT